MNLYAKMKNRHQEEVNNLPLGFAFSNQQFYDMMSDWGLNPETDLDKILKIGGGGFVQKKDRKLMEDTFDRHTKELEEAIKGDLTGEDFIYEMWLYELDNHEFGYTGDLSDTMDALGFSAEDLESNTALDNGLNKAVAVIKRRGL